MNPATARFLYATVIFVGAFLSFEIQPLVGKIVTAGFGGSAAIWGVCLLFFQSVLLFGYSLTYLLSRLSPPKQSLAYAAIVLVSAACLNLPEPSAWGADTQGGVAITLLTVLASHLAFPCLILSSISGMMQMWFNLSKLGNPYPLYSLSNVGSLGALLAYPLIIEPVFSLTNTISCWRYSYYLLALLVCASALSMYRFKPASVGFLPANSNSIPEVQGQVAAAGSGGFQPAESKIETADQSIEGSGESIAHPEQSPSWKDYAWWILLSSIGTLALVSYTAYLTQDVAPVPLIYVIPLCLYLLSFIITFAGEQFYKRALMIYITPLLWIAEAGVSSLWVDKTHETLAMNWSVIAVLTFMFSFFFTCQGELYRSKPPAKYLASFYLAIAFGGTLGGIFVNLGAPAIFNTYVERYLVGAFIALLWISVTSTSFHKHKWDKIANCVYAVMVGVSLVFLFGAGNPQSSKLISQQRNFFGCLSVFSKDNYIVLKNGRIMHGKQYTDKDNRLLPTLYYGEGTGLDLIDKYLRSLHPEGHLHYGLIGLGAGTIAAYGREGDTLEFYEIDPKVINTARKHFTYLADSKAQVHVTEGDARTQLKKQAPQKFNLLVVDAFNGDAIPVHLLTREAMNLYFSHLLPDGVLLVHVTNRFIDLEPVLGNLAGSMNLKAFTMSDAQGDYVGISRAAEFKPAVPSDEKSEKRFEDLDIKPVRSFSPIGIWTDDYSNLFATMVAKWQKKTK